MNVTKYRLIIPGLLVIAALLGAVVNSAASRAAEEVGVLADVPVSPQSCTTDEDCNDGNACTVDSCEADVCVNEAIVPCVPCDDPPVCPPVELVFVMDTSGSMGDEAAALCNNIGQITAELEAVGVSVSSHLLGITETPGGVFDCLTSDVVTMLGGNVPGDAAGCPFPGTFADHESWGPATAIIAERFPWAVDSVRVVVPLSDEGPCNGSLPDGCNATGDDGASIANAITVATDNGVTVSPITGTGSDSCVTTLAENLAAGTGGVTFQSKDPGLDLAGAVHAIVLDLCEPAPCDDGNDCTVNDRCIDGVCLGDTPDDLLIPCDEDSDCEPYASKFGWFCEESRFDKLAGYCNCESPTPLCVEFDRACYEEGGVVDARIVMGYGTAEVAGGQFLMEYDPSCVEFVSIEPCDDSIFVTVIAEGVDETAGRIWYAALAYDPVTQTAWSTQGPHDIACMTFNKLPGCDSCNICLLSQNPQNTLLTDNHGQSVWLENCVCSEDITVIRDTEIVCPESMSVDTDAGQLSAVVTWDDIQTSSNCGEAVELECMATHSLGISIDHLIQNGGTFPAGVATFYCMGKDSSVCYDEDECSWTIEVNAVNTVEASIQLSPPVSAGMTERCIEFEFFANCVSPPTVVQELVVFGGPYSLPGVSEDVILSIPANLYECATARDPLHTLRSTTRMVAEDGVWKVKFAGDPIYGGNWLVGGDLTNDGRIDALDLGAFFAHPQGELAENPVCQSEVVHPDIDGDGIVGAVDQGIIVQNWGEVSMDSCCPTGGTSSVDPPVDEISVKELRRRGLGHYGAADRNNDAVVNIDDGTAAGPETSPTAKRTSLPRR